MTETTCEITENMHMAAKIPALKLNEEIIRCARDVNAPRISPPRQKTGSTDLGNVMELIPGSCIRVAFVDEHAAAHSQEFLDQERQSKVIMQSFMERRSLQMSVTIWSRYLV